MGLTGDDLAGLFGGLGTDQFINAQDCYKQNL